MQKKRAPTLDRQLDLAWLNLKIRGTERVRPSEIDRRIVGLTLRAKSASSAGMQLADLVVSPIGRHVLGKRPKQNWSIIETKLRTCRGNYIGAGLVVLPRRSKK